MNIQAYMTFDCCYVQGIEDKNDGEDRTEIHLDVQVPFIHLEFTCSLWSPLEYIESFLDYM